LVTFCSSEGLGFQSVFQSKEAEEPEKAKHARILERDAQWANQSEEPQITQISSFRPPGLYVAITAFLYSLSRFCHTIASRRLVGTMSARPGA